MTDYLAVDFVEVKLAPDSSKTGEFEGYGAVFGNTDSHGDVIQHGAFAETLAGWKAKGKLPPMLLNHGGVIPGLKGIGGVDDLLPVGKWTHMQEDSTGLYAKGKLFALDTQRGRYIHEGLKSGALDGMSIGYKTIKARNGVRATDPDRTLLNLHLVELSLATFPSNDRATVISAKSLSVDELRELEDILGDRGFSRTDRTAAVSVFKSWLQRDAGAPANTPRDADVSEAAIVEALRALSLPR